MLMLYFFPGSLLSNRVGEFVFNVTPTENVIWRRGYGIELSESLEEPGIELRTPVYKVRFHNGAGKACKVVEYLHQD